jgi:hypothetical protein
VVVANKTVAVAVCVVICCCCATEISPSVSNQLSLRSGVDKHAIILPVAKGRPKAGEEGALKET